VKNFIKETIKCLRFLKFEFDSYSSCIIEMNSLKTFCLIALKLSSVALDEISINYISNLFVFDDIHLASAVFAFLRHHKKLTKFHNSFFKQIVFNYLKNNGQKDELHDLIVFFFEVFVNILS